MKPTALVACSILVLMAATPPVVFAVWQGGEPSAAKMAARAKALLDSLDAAQREKASFAFGDAERTKWHFVPNLYPGLPLQEMSDVQKRHLHRLLHTALSTTGYHKSTTIMHLEEILRAAAEAQGRDAPSRDPGRYSWAIFGTPGGTDAWGFRLQGHHISWNFTSVDNRIVATTPAFLGANPAEVRQGPHAGLRALPDEADLGFALLASLTPDQRKTAILSDQAPRDVLWGPDRARDVLGEPRGVAYADMTATQQALLWDLVRTYVGNMEPAVAAVQLAAIRRAGLGAIRFAWMGAGQPGAGHYYRIHGPTFAIEYDNTQNNANHVHTVWHDLTGDFAVDLLRQHYHNEHSK